MMAVVVGESGPAGQSMEADWVRELGDDEQFREDAGHARTLAGVVPAGHSRTTAAQTEP
jgi:hypothetical protein